jgi:hypothetical protein
MATLSPVRTWQMATLAAFSHLKNRVFAPFYGGYNGNLMRYGGDMRAHTEKDRNMNINIYIYVNDPQSHKEDIAPTQSLHPGIHRFRTASMLEFASDRPQVVGVGGDPTH